MLCDRIEIGRGNVSIHVESPVSKAAKGIGRTMNSPVSCALDMARRAWPGLRSYTLVALAHRHGLETRGHHRALIDCALTLPIYCAAAAQLGGVD